MIRHEPGVEAALFQLLREADQVPQVEIGVGISPGIAPPSRVDARRAHESAEP